jgi:phage baseplate assembly protein gpV
MGFFIVQYDSQGKPIHIDLGGGGGYGWRTNGVHSAHVSLAAVGQPWLDLGRNDNLQWQPQSPFTTLTAGDIELTANPDVLGWNHQSFGISDSTLPAFVAFSAATFGSITHPSAVPPSGTATFAGKLAGLYVSPAGDGSIATANLTVNADFGARSLGFASTGTTTTRDAAIATPAPGLDLSGTLRYLPGSNTFAGELRNAGGSMSGDSTGQFYGPLAEELGGVFTLKSPDSVETFAGAYGAEGPARAGAAFTPSPAGLFTSFAQMQRDENMLVKGVSAQIQYGTQRDSLGVQSVSATAVVPGGDALASFGFDQAGAPVYLQTSSGYAWSGVDRSKTLTALGHPEVEIGRGAERWQQPGTQFADIKETTLALVANPWSAGWDYQTFGVWDNFGSIVAAGSFGNATPGPSVPTSGAATFSGKLAGLYVSPTGQGSMAAADLTVNANFSTRTLGFASTGTATTRDFQTKTAAPQLNLNGTLAYSPGSNTFSGTLTNAGGTMSGNSKGQFYGPSAQELGGAFVVKSPTTVETFTGAYGAKR